MATECTCDPKKLEVTHTHSPECPYRKSLPDNNAEVMKGLDNWLAGRCQ